MTGVLKYTTIFSHISTDYVKAGCAVRRQRDMLEFQKRLWALFNISNVNSVGP